MNKIEREWPKIGIKQWWNEALIVERVELLTKAGLPPSLANIEWQELNNYAKGIISNNYYPT